MMDHTLASLRYLRGTKPESFSLNLDLYSNLPSGDVRWMISAGCDRYVEVRSQNHLPPLAFVVQKDRVSREITLEITSLPLKRSVQSVIMGSPKSQASPKIDIDMILMSYDALRTHLQHLEKHSPQDEATDEARLLVSDLLPERALYEGIGFEAFRKRGVLCPVLVQDIHHKSVCMGLDEIEDCFSLGAVPDNGNEGHVQRFNAKFTSLAHSGDHLSLQDLCEPVVRSGEIEFQYNPGLLMELLDNGYVDSYLYILNLIDRTRPCLEEAWDPEFPDITFDPMHVAIRLGHKDVVQSFITAGNVFEGRVYEDDQPVGGHVFTPLFSAVFWGQKDIVSLLLQCGPIYSPGYQPAITLALSSGMQDIIQSFIENKALGSPGSFLSSFPASWVAPNAPSAPIYLGPTSSPGILHEFAHSMPEVTGKLSNLNDPNAPRGPWSGMPPDITHSGPSTPLFHPGPPSFLSSASEYVDPCFTWKPRSSDGQGILKEPVKETGSHKALREQSQKLVARLEQKLRRVSDFCRDRPSQDFADFNSSEFASAERVWASGTHGFRRIVRNRTPSTLVEVMQCLLLADALTYQFSSQSRRLQTQ